MLRKYLIQHYVDLQEIEELLGHSSFVYLRGVVLYSVLLFLVYVGYAIWHQYAPELLYIKWIAGVVGLAMFVFWVVSFLNLYLDCLLLSKNSLTVFLWDGILEYRTEVLDWSKINVISYKQDSLRDRIFGKGDIVIQVGNVDFSFNDIYYPKKYVSKLMLYKKNYEDTQKIKIEQDLAGDQKNFEVIMGALGEVIREYLEENPQKVAEVYEEEGYEEDAAREDDEEEA
ncbi:MAG: hypothetical protein LBU27_04595 [Candidatus Peribacteria bacterium]|jgi:uncharacterized membrane protein (DUF485 family)|nr:hypothetical protein [Candidatus Peribacteria bacterium]